METPSSSAVHPLEVETEVVPTDLEVVQEETITETTATEKTDTKQQPDELNAVASFLLDWWFTTLIGFLVVSYWRGTWVLLDIWTCQQPSDAGMVNGGSFCFGGLGFVTKVRYDSAWQTYLAGNLLLFAGVTMMGRGWWSPAAEPGCTDAPITLQRAALRVFIVYVLGAAAVCIWHGIWYFIDYYVMPDDFAASSWMSTVIGAGLCYVFCAGASMLAPPAIFLMDGPGTLPPPIAVTIYTSYRCIAYPAEELKADKDPWWIVVPDVLISFVLLPWGVVGFWRGFWYLMDWYFWGLTPSDKDFWMSLLWSTLLGMGALLLGSEDVAQYFPESSATWPKTIKVANEIFERVRTLVLGIGAVNFWRVVWYLWDEFMGKTSNWSGALSHVLGVLGLLGMGCMACICAPAATLGVDAVAHPDCADEPLFHNVPVPAEALEVLSIGRQPPPPPGRPPLIRQYSTRFMQQTSAQLRRHTRTTSCSTWTLSRRHLEKRQKSQFYRSR